MKKIVNVYSATNGTEKLAQGEGNSKSITAGFTQKEYDILLAQNRFEWFDEEAMKDPELVPVGMKHAGTDMWNTMNADIFAEYKKGSLTVPASAPNFDAFVDAVAALNIESDEDVTIFGFVCPEDKAAVRKALKDDLKYIEAFARTGYIGTVAGVNLYTKADATKGEIVVATKEAVTIFNKKGIESEQKRDPNTRQNDVFTRKYYVVALTNEAKAVKITLGA